MRVTDPADDNRCEVTGPDEHFSCWHATMHCTEPCSRAIREFSTASLARTGGSPTKPTVNAFGGSEKEMTLLYDNVASPGIQNDFLILFKFTNDLNDPILSCFDFGKTFRPKEFELFLQRLNRPLGHGRINKLL